MKSCSGKSSKKDIVSGIIPSPIPAIFLSIPSNGCAMNLITCQQELEKVTGQPVRWFRPPFGVTNPTLAKAVRRLGYIPIGWNIRTLDTQQPTPEKIIKRIKKRLVPGSILLLHDRMPDSDRLLVQVLDFIEKEGYTVVALDRLIKQIT